MFESLVSPAGDMAGVFEATDGTGYFYLCSLGNNQEGGILNAIWVFNGEPEFAQTKLQILWSHDSRVVFLIIFGQLIAAFDSADCRGYGTGFPEGIELTFPPEILDRLPGQFTVHPYNVRVP